MNDATVAGRGARCGKVIANDNGRDVLCDLVEGHADSKPCIPSSDDMKALNSGVIADFRLRVGLADSGDRLILLTTLGARTGRPRTTPVESYRDGERMLVVASNLAAERHPDWYVNLVANPSVTVETRNETYQGVAAPLVREERDRVWTRLVLVAPFLADHQANTARTLPVVGITRA